MTSPDHSTSANETSENAAAAAQPLASVLLRRLAPAYILFALAVISTQLTVEYRIVREDLRKTMHALANVAAPSAEIALWEFQNDLLKPLADGISSHPEVVRVVITDTTGKQITSWQSATDNMPSELMSIHRPLIRHEGDITHSLGTLSIYSSERIALERLKESMRAVLNVAVLHFLFLGIILWLLLRSEIVKPLAAFAARVKTLHDSASPKTLELNHYEIAEIETLQLAFTMLIGRLRESHALITQQNTDLEQRVIERTLALENEEARFRSIFERTNTAIAFANPAGDLVDFNSSFAALLECSRNELLGLSISKFTYAGDIDREMLLFNEIIDDKRNDYRIEKRYVTKSGKIIWVDLSVTVIRHPQGGIQSFVGLMVDITERKRASDTVRANEAKLRALFELSPVGIARNSFDGRYIEANQSLLDMVGYSLEELNQLSYGDLTPRAYDEQEAAQLKSLEETGRYGPYEKHYIHRDGHLIPVALNGVVVTDSNEEKYIWSLIEDITDRKAAEEAVHRARQAAEIANQAKSEFLANMSHEIRTPMNAIMGLTQLVMDTELDAEQSDYLHKAYSASKALLGILNDILDYSKIEAGRLDIGSWPLNVEHVLGEVAHLFGASIHEKHLELFVEISPEIPSVVLGDALRLTQVLNNLIGNAVKFTERGEIHLKAEVVGRQDHGLTLQFSVRDTGIGLSNADVDRLFQPFTQADGTITRKYGGTGLGLTISQRLVELMGGAFSVTGAVGKGATFVFTLQVQSADINEENQPDLQQLRNLNVLIADDQETSRLILGKLFAQWGIPAKLLSSGAEVLALIRESLQNNQPYDIVLLDMQMPVLNGLNTAKEIASLAKASGHVAPRIFIMATAQEKPQLTSQSKEVHIDDVLTKPITPSHLLDTLVGRRTATDPDDPAGDTSNSPIRSRSGTRESALAGRRFDGARVLLVEDNVTNQLVATQFLERRGITVTVANHGAEAVDWVGKENFDMVLMDLHMPIMGGLEATLQIHALPQGRNLPVVAMTAAVMQDDKNRCEASGMVDFVGKPIDPDDLAEVLTRWLPEKFHRTAQPSPTHSAGSTDTLSRPMHPLKQTDGIPNIPGVDVESALRRLGNEPTLLLTLLSEFARQQGHTVDEIQSALSTGNRNEAAAHLHAIKGAAGNLGANTVATLAGKLEKEIRDSEQIPSLTEFETIFRDLLKNIEKVGHAASQHEQPLVTDTASIDCLFAKLRPYLETRDLVPREYVSELRRISLVEEYQALLDRLQGQLQRFDYDGAMASMTELSARLHRSAAD